ncbi:thioredoxin-like domain-containing protein [uncultured Dokdonia sp.]|uniref:TlpA family protein disulfide reductase n=1 Tax=uncultured Dokdonia sp. TaxID=575653 RepID=UPI00261107BC|nr:thioredoxin-like domain-containing protein [uncultured Dokdonia sp.]
MLSACDATKGKKSNATYLGGEIINPKRDHILLQKNDKIIDTIPLDAHNRFLYEFKDFEPGLYRFWHRENQLIHIESGDSIMMRVNTVEFDESLSFSGKGSERSRFLIDLFLQWEEENEGFIHHYQKEPKDFETLLDSIHQVRLKKLAKFYEKYDNVSENFKEIAEASVHYDNYQRRESYPFSHYKKNDKLTFIEELPSDFYSFRESINLNNTNLRDLYPYQRYLNAFLDHQAYKGYCQDQSYNTVSFLHNYNEIKVIDKHIENPELKDMFLYRTGRRFIENSNDKEGVSEIFKLVTASMTSQKTKSEIQQLYTSHKKMETGNVIPDLILVDSEQRMVTLSSRIRKPTALYFWSYNNHMHLEESHKKAKDLQAKYPEFNFIGINVNNETGKWIKHIKQHKFNPSMEYRFDNAQNARKSLVINNLSKTIVLDKNGKILNSHANIHSIDFESELLAYLNQ